MSLLDDRGWRSGALAQLGVLIAFLGFGLLAFDAALGVVLIPAGIVLSFAGMRAAGRR
jgi:hypothetical protein